MLHALARTPTRARARRRRDARPRTGSAGLLVPPAMMERAASGGISRTSSSGLPRTSSGGEAVWRLEEGKLVCSFGVRSLCTPVARLVGWEELEFVRELGSGSFGEVSLRRWSGETTVQSSPPVPDVPVPVPMSSPGPRSPDTLPPLPGVAEPSSVAVKRLLLTPGYGSSSTTA